ncbi:MAG: sensor domain-containing diguanylate cyclase [Lachnospiraceae bacterium]|nr:sensor domain-containing diguanylate cyclase [Lachnospiraceae bacterium]
MKKRFIYVILIGIINMVIISVAYYVYVQREIYNIEKNYMYIAEDKAYNISTTIESVIIRIDAIKILIQDHNGESEFFESLSDDLYDNVKNETGISLKYISIAPDGVVSDVYPLLTNEKLIGYDYMDVTKTGNVTDTDIYNLGNPILTNSYDIKQGGFGVSGTLPVFYKEGGKSNLWGLVGFNIPYDSLTESLKLDSLDDLGMNYRLTYIDSHNTRHIIQESSVKPENEISVRFNIENLVWELSLSPKNGWYPVHRIVITSVILLILSVFVSLFANIMFRLRESYLMVVMLSNTDRLTDCFNRRAYEDKLSELSNFGISKDFVYIAVDINGLKKVNDTLGHQAGDEMICGAATLLKNCYKEYGNVYRIGGDEFAVMIQCDEEKLEERKNTLTRSMIKWKGKYVQQLAMSLGYASFRETPNKSIYELAKLADERMYDAKRNFYISSGQDRRGR